MTSDEIRLLIPQYLSDQLTAEERRLFEAELSTDSQLRAEVEDLQPLWEYLGALPEERPRAAMRAQFYRKLNVLTGESREAGRVRAPWWRLGFAGQFAGAAAMLLLGILIGRGNTSRNATGEDVAQLRAQLQTLRQTVALSLLERQSASSRLEGVSWGTRVDRPDSELISALLDTLSHDANTNVRLAALDALEKFGSDAGVQPGLVTAISHQDSPLVQIALIDALVHMRDNSAAAEIRKLSGDGSVNAAVRQRAQWALAKLE